MVSDFEVPMKTLQWRCDPNQFFLKETSKLSELDEVIGQERAVQAISFGLNMNDPAYHIFVTGLEGTGKTTIVQEIVRRYAKDGEAPCDWCLVNNFRDEYKPRSISLPPGNAFRFKRRMERLIEDLKIRLPKAVESESSMEEIQNIKAIYHQKQEAVLSTLEQLGKDKNLGVVKTPKGFQAHPLIEGKPVKPDAFDALPKAAKDTFEKNFQAIASEITSAEREISKYNHLLQREIEHYVGEGLGPLREDYIKCPEVLGYLNEVQNHITENSAIFFGAGEGKERKARQQASDLQSTFQVYQVNVLVDQNDKKGAPVVFEANPSYFNVFGRIEKSSPMGMGATNFTKVRAGSLLEANGGYLIMEIESILSNPNVWESLKRALLSRQLFIDDGLLDRGMMAPSIKPQAIPLDVKIILLGAYETFRMLQNHDAKFNKIFKVRADFDHETALNEKHLKLYARFIARVVKEKNLKPFSKKGVAAIIDFAKQLGGKRDKLSLRFGAIVGMIQEAAFWAERENVSIVTDLHVHKAFEEYRFRYNLFEEKTHENYVDETIMIDVVSDVAGQVNALAVYEIGDFRFGRPSRITAETYMGKDGIVSIEREAKLSGKTHDKGVMTLSGYLGRMFAQKTPLNLNISIGFEQNYSGVDGDSASSTELYAILSSLSGIPIHQGIAVTGSVNQKGQIQAIGGVNQKIEGFFDVCQSKGLTGNQGVMIPKANVKNLMLKQKVLDAVEKGEFHIYQVARIEEGIEVLTQTPAGECTKTQGFSEGSVFHAVQKKLTYFAEMSYKDQRVIKL